MDLQPKSRINVPSSHEVDELSQSSLDSQSSQESQESAGISESSQESCERVSVNKRYLRERSYGASSLKKVCKWQENVAAVLKELSEPKPVVPRTHDDAVALLVATGLREEKDMTLKKLKQKIITAVILGNEKDLQKYINI